MKVLLTLFMLVPLITYLPAQTISFSSSCETTYFCINDFNCDSSPVEFTVIATTTCNTGGLAISYTIDFYENGSVDESGMGNTVNGNYPLGNHRVVFSATDNCGNEENCDFLFLVEDCTAPVAMTYNGIAGETNPSQEWLLNADDINLGSTDNCGISAMLLVSPSQGPGQVEPPVEASESIVFSCDDLGTNSLDFWVGDAAGNWSYKSTYALVQNNIAPFCPNIGTLTLCLNSITECGNPIGNVNYSVGIPGIPDGIFNFNPCDDIPFENNLVLSAYKDINPLNGVSTFDMVLIAKHILGNQLLDSPYKIISADANHSGSVSTIDLVEIRKLILGVIPTFSNNTSWRFVDSSFVFPNPQNPFQTSIPENCSINGGTESFEKTFIGMKIGDVNKSAFSGDSLVTSEVEVRNTFTFDLIDQVFEAGDNINLDFYASNIDEYAGFQFALDFDTAFLEYIKFEKGSLKQLDESNFGVQKDKGLIAASWVNMDFEQIEKAKNVLFSLQFTALQSGSLKDFIKVSSSRLSPEAYTNDLNISTLNIRFSEVVPNIDFVVESTPNPFREETKIQFDLQQSESVTLKIIDLKGSVIKKINKELEKGSNEVILGGDIFPSSGVYFYQLETSNKSITKKLLKID
jgi:type IX secretion system substrate protein/cohesin domain-containing protein